MSLERMDHVTVVVDDLPGAIAFFTALGMALEGQASVGGATVDRLCGIDGVEADIAMMRTPDGHGRVELTKYRRPAPVAVEPAIAPPHALGLRQVMVAVDDIDDTVARLRAHGARLVGDIVQYEDAYRLCYVRAARRGSSSRSPRSSPDAHRAATTARAPGRGRCASS